MGSQVFNVDGCPICAACSEAEQKAKSLNFEQLKKLFMSVNSVDTDQSKIAQVQAKK